MDTNTPVAPQVQAQPQPPVTQPTATAVTPQKPTVAPASQNASYVTRLFQGRLNRRNYWVGATVLLIVPLVLFLISLVTTLLFPTELTLPPIDSEASYVPDTMNPIVQGVSIVSAVITLIYSLLLIPYLISLQVRRLHDLNQSGWLILLSFVPAVNSLFSLYVGFFPGSDTENTYGPVPPSKINIKEDIFRFKPKV